MAKDTKKPKTIPKVEEIDRVTYCGPSIPTLGLLHGSTFVGGLPEQIKTLADDNPFIKPLFVEPQDVGIALVAISTHGTVLHSLAGRARNIAIKRGEKA
ncbi:hypothetical protein [Aminobacterium sp. UBA5514]|uniref:hypothetical protein n=1 Tax=Aminobacterium sp. UBA5514 TaxID=1946036 RepID=UPI00257DDF31|nr:hypothetical protein [Aminobacterium sp. UBA5514]